MSSDNKAIVSRLYIEVWNERKLELVDELFAESHALNMPNVFGAAIGPEAYKRHVMRFFAGFPDLRFAIEDVVCENDKVVVSWVISGTHKGEFLGIPPTNKKVSVGGITINCLGNGKILDSNVVYDTLDLLKQLGVAPPLEQAKGASADR
jgi:steroid delta-isomerase-like uncharacterized protein